MVSTEDFIKSITSDDTSQMVAHHFDELMVLYHLVGNRTDIDVSTSNTKRGMEFNLLMEDEAAANKFVSRNNGMNFSVYGEKYKINASPSGTSVSTFITKQSGSN